MREAEAREHGIVHDLQDYIPQRRENSAVKPCFALIKITLPIPLPEDVFEDRDFQQVYYACLDMV